MPDISINERRLEIFDGCISRTSPPPDAAIAVVGSSWKNQDSIISVPFLSRHEIATIDAHLGSIVIANQTKTPDDSGLILDCVVEAVKACDDITPIELNSFKFCPALIKATELFYQQTGRT